jgi:uncharacterized protein (DUF4415 family)
MNTETEIESVKRSKEKVRGKSVKKVPKTHVNVRLSPEVLDFYKRFPSYTGKMREVLTEYMRKQTDKKLV